MRFSGTYLRRLGASLLAILSLCLIAAPVVSAGQAAQVQQSKAAGKTDTHEQPVLLAAMDGSGTRPEEQSERQPRRRKACTCMRGMRSLSSASRAGRPVPPTVATDRAANATPGVASAADLDAGTTHHAASAAPGDRTHGAYLASPSDHGFSARTNFAAAHATPVLDRTSGAGALAAYRHKLAASELLPPGLSVPALRPTGPPIG